jgi:putative redox protein
VIRSNSIETPYRAEFSDGRHVAGADLPRSKGGAGDGFGPHDLLEAALATCIVITVRLAAEKRAIAIGDVSCRVRLDRSVPGPVHFRYSLWIEGDLTDDQSRVLHEAASRCPVSRTLTGGISVQEVDQMDSSPEATP